MNRKIISILTIACIVPILNAPINAEAVTNTQAVTPYSTGLIDNYDLSISLSNKTINLYAITDCNYTMKSIGIKSVKLQRSSNGTSWTTVSTIGDILSENVPALSTNKSIGTGSSGYYYRVTCTHYAKESGLFGSSESISNTSNSVYIP